LEVQQLMEWLNAQNLFAILTIIIADLMLAGDNALVIGLACRGLPPAQKRRALLWGTGGAVVLRIILTCGVTLLLAIPFLQAAGGILLTWVALKLLLPHKEVGVGAAENLTGAIKTIIIADVVMSLDNVLAVAAAAHGSIALVVFGLVLSIPIVIFGSQLVSLLVERYPILIFAGAGVLAWTAGKMLVEDRVVHRLVSNIDYIPVEIIIPAGVTLLVLGAGWHLKRRGHMQATVKRGELT
jgi:YjbE family integral membrane protein